MRYSDGSGISANANAKAFVWSVKFTPKIRTESGKLSSIGCHFTPELTNFGTLGGGGGGGGRVSAGVKCGVRVHVPGVQLAVSRDVSVTIEQAE